MRIKLACLVGLLLAGSVCKAQASNEDESLIRSQAKSYVEAFNNADAHGLAMQWTEEGTYTDVNGLETCGRGAIEKLFVDNFKHGHKDKLSVLVESVRFPAPELAIEEGRASLNGSNVHYVAVHSKMDGKWPMVSVVETPSQVGGSTRLGAVGWLEGVWVPRVPASVNKNVAQRVNAVKLNVHSIAEKKFLQVDFCSDKSATVPTETELIGYDPRAGSLASWYFNGAGVGYGRWHNGKNNEWLVHARNISAEGTVSRATYRLRKVDDNTFLWKSFDRFAGRRHLPDTEELTMIRSSDK